jgi:hypothetical protein
MISVLSEFPNFPMAMFGSWDRRAICRGQWPPQAAWPRLGLCPAFIPRWRHQHTETRRQPDQLNRATRHPLRHRDRSTFRGVPAPTGVAH